MGNQLALLKMLMPTVRPDGITPSNSSPKLPLEEQNFEQMLMEMQKTEALPPESLLEQESQESKSSPMQMMQQLGGVDRIENPALRAMLALGKDQR